MEKKKPIKLTKGQEFRRALTHVALQAQDRIESGKPVGPFEEAIRRAMNTRLERDPRFAWK